MTNWLERKMGWIAFPSIIRYLALFQLGVLGLSFVNPGASDLLEFNWGAILSGEVWRLLTYIFVPIGSLSGEGAMTTAVFAVFAALLMMRFGDGLEERLGVFKSSLFFYGGWLSGLVASLIFSTSTFGYLGTTSAGDQVFISQVLSPGIIFNASILFAFATFYPKFRLRLFFFLPVPVWIIAAISGVSLLLTGLNGFGFIAFTLICLTHYLVLAIPALKARIAQKGRQITHTVKSKPTEAFHICESCGIKDSENPKEVFRVTAEGLELCGSCLEQKSKHTEN